MGQAHHWVNVAYRAITTLLTQARASDAAVRPRLPLVLGASILKVLRATPPNVKHSPDVKHGCRAVAASGKSGQKAHAMLTGQKAPVARTIIHQCQRYVAGLNAGKSAAEVNAGRDKAAASEINALWTEVKAATIAAAKKKARARP